MSQRDPTKGGKPSPSISTDLFKVLVLYIKLQKNLPINKALIG